MATTQNEMRIYRKGEVVSFRTTTGEFGPLSNMAPDFPIFISNVRIATAEALYQACRFPDHPDVQRLIIDQMSPMTAKMKSKKYRGKTRADWDDVRVNVMRWCLRTKLQDNWARFGNVLERTGDRPIVEESKKDEFWGAKPQDDGTLVGRNVLGRLLMELRLEFREVVSDPTRVIRYPVISHFMLFGSPIEPTRKCPDATRNWPGTQTSMFDRDSSHAKLGR